MPIVVLIHGTPEMSNQHSTPNCPAANFVGKTVEGHPTIYGASDLYDDIARHRAVHDDTDEVSDALVHIVTQHTNRLCVRCKERIITEVFTTLAVEGEVLTHEAVPKHYEVRDADDNVVQLPPRHTH